MGPVRTLAHVVPQSQEEQLSALQVLFCRSDVHGIIAGWQGSKTSHARSLCEE